MVGEWDVRRLSPAAHAIGVVTYRTFSPIRRSFVQSWNLGKRRGNLAPVASVFEAFPPRDGFPGCFAVLEVVIPPVFGVAELLLFLWRLDGVRRVFHVESLAKPGWRRQLADRCRPARAARFVNLQTQPMLFAHARLLTFVKIFKECFAHSFNAACALAKFWRHVFMK